MGFPITRRPLCHFLILGLAATAQAESLEDHIESTLAGRGMTRSGVKWAYAVESLEDNDILAAGGADDSLKPASNLKVLTAAALLDFAGPDHRVPTTIFANGSREDGTLTGDLWVQCLADPTFNSAHSGSASAALRNLADTIMQTGIRRVTGDLVITGLFVYADGEGAARALGGGSANTLVLSASSDDIGELTPTDNGTARIVDEEDFFRECNLAAGRRLRGLLEDDLGMDIEGEVRTSTRLDPPGTQVARRLSPPLSAILPKVLYRSINLHADLLLLHLGYVKREALTLSDGIAAARAWLGETGVDMEGFRMCDGSGLSHRNRMTARQLLAVLSQMDDSSSRGAWLECLPVAGRTGTMRNRMRGTVAEGNLRAKTGTLTGAISLSGYATDTAGRRMAFAIIENSPFGAPLPRSQARSVIDNIAVAVATGYEVEASSRREEVEVAEVEEEPAPDSRTEVAEEPAARPRTVVEVAEAPAARNRTAEIAEALDSDGEGEGSGHAQGSREVAAPRTTTVASRVAARAPSTVTASLARQIASMSVAEAFSESERNRWQISRGANLERVRRDSPSGDGVVGRLVRQGRGEVLALTGPEDTRAVAVEAEVNLAYRPDVDSSPDVPYQGLVVRASGQNWVRFVADFDSDRCIKIQAQVNGSWERLAQWSFPNDFPDPGRGGWHIMRLELNGSQMRAFFDGRPLPGGDIEFQGFPLGRAGLYAYHWGEQQPGDRIAHFDDFRIEPLTPRNAVASSR